MVRISRAAPRLTDPLNDIQFVSYVGKFLGMMSIKLRMAEGYAKKTTYNMSPVHLCVEIVDERAQASGFFVLVSVQIAGEVLALDRKIPTPRQPAKVTRRAWTGRNNPWPVGSFMGAVSCFPNSICFERHRCIFHHLINDREGMDNHCFLESH